MTSAVRPAGARRWTAVFGALALLVAGAHFPAGADPLDDVVGNPGSTLPDLVPDIPIFFIDRPLAFDEATQTSVPGPPVLHFDTQVQNLGVAALQLTIEEPDDADLSAVSQCVSWRADHVCREQRVIPGLRWRGTTGRFRLDGFASHELRHLLPNGRVDYSHRGLAGTRKRTAMCPHDYQRVRPEAFPAPYYNQCTQVLTGVSPGWTDLYDFGEPEQQFPIAGLPDGGYAVVVRVNNAGLLHETDAGNNVVEVIFDLSNGATEATIVERRRP